MSIFDDFERELKRASDMEQGLAEQRVLVNQLRGQVLAKVQGTPTIAKARGPKRGGVRRGSNMAALIALVSDGAAHSFLEIQSLISGSKATTSTLLHRAMRAGRIVRVRLGHYAGTDQQAGVENGIA